METCERCGGVTSSGVWTRNNGICDKCRISELERAMQGFCDAHKIAKNPEFQYGYTDKYYFKFMELLK